MYCPKCGDVLEERYGTFVCIRGDMPLSRGMAEGLYTHFISKSEIPEAFRTVRRLGAGRWYCPACGVLMREDSSHEVRCPECGRDIGPFAYHLIELHPHLGDGCVDPADKS